MDVHLKTVATTALVKAKKAIYYNNLVTLYNRYNRVIFGGINSRCIALSARSHKYDHKEPCCHDLADQQKPLLCLEEDQP